MRISLSKIIVMGVLLAMSPVSLKAKSKAVVYAPVLWMDASANIDRTNSTTNIANILDKCVDAGIKTIIVDAKPGSGLVIYDSKIAPKLVNWKGKTYDPNFDRLKVTIEEGHKRGLKVFADFFVFSEGHGIYKVGPIFDTHPEWAAVLFTKNGLVPGNLITDKVRGNTNPVNPEIQRYELSLMEEVVKNYDVDGILLDGCRFDSINADYSELTRAEFEKYLRVNRPRQRRGQIRNWPNNILHYDSTTTNIIYGPDIKDWTLFRAQVIHDFVQKARTMVKSIKPKVLFTDYAGSWYPVYNDVGVNWASKKYIPKYDWVPKGYEKTGYAEMLDFFCTGNYYFDVSKEEAIAKKNESWKSVEGATETVNEVVKGVTPVYGTIYIADYQDHPRQFVRAMEMLKKKTNGIALFDLSQLDGYDYWKWVKLATSKSILTDEDISAVPESDKAKKAVMPPSTAEDFAVDNNDSGFSASGDWNVSSSATGFIGKNYMTHAAGTGKNSVKWTPNILFPGRYRVSVNWTSGDNRADNAIYTIHFKNGEKKITISQKEKGGQWIELGTYEFDKGISGYVLLTDQANGYVIADAVRFTKVQ